jgi:hypothetical protein
MPALKKRPKSKANIDIEIRQDPDLKAAFDFWVRSIYLNRPSGPQATSCEALSHNDDHKPSETHD